MTIQPPNATALQVALSATSAALNEIPSPVSAVWRPTSCPAELLPWLAWALSVDAWDSDWTEARKRAVIAASYDVHRRKGTVGAVRRAIEALGYRGIEITEGVPPRAHDATLLRNGSESYGVVNRWALFRVRIDLGNDQGWAPRDADAARQVIDAAKNARSHLYAIGIKATLSQPRETAAVAALQPRVGLALLERRTGIRDGAHRRATPQQWLRDGTTLFDGSAAQRGLSWSGLRFGRPRSTAPLRLGFGLASARRPHVPRTGLIDYSGRTRRDHAGALSVAHLSIRRQAVHAAGVVFCVANPLAAITHVAFGTSTAPTADHVTDAILAPVTATPIPSEAPRGQLVSWSADAATLAGRPIGEIALLRADGGIVARMPFQTDLEPPIDGALADVWELGWKTKRETWR